MRANGNGTPIQCVENLLSTIRGEVPFDRVKGLNARAIDMPIGDATEELTQDAKWNIETYEPRAAADEIEITVDESENGGFQVTASIEDA